MTLILVPDANPANDLTGALTYPSAPVVNGVPAGTYKAGRLAWNPVALVVASMASAPTVTAPPNVAGGTVAGQTLTFAAATFASATPILQRQARIRRNGAVIPGVIEPFYPLRAADVGAVFDRQERVRNAGGWSDWATSATTAIVTAATVPTDAPAGVTINDLPRDRMIFDAGLTMGRNAAQVPISGTATENAKPIYARHPSMGAWVQVSAGAVGGVWSGTLPVPTCDYGPIEVLQAGGTTTAMTTVMSSGLVALYYTQSEHEQGMDQGPTGGFRGPNLARQNMQYAYFRAAEITANEGPRFREPNAVGAASPLGATPQSIAKMFELYRPDLNVYLIYSSVGGTSWNVLVDDTQTGRDFGVEDRFFAEATSGRITGVGMIVAPGSMAAQQQGRLTVERIGGALTGRKPDGSLIAAGEIFAGWRFDHTALETVPDENVPIIVGGPHRYERGSQDQAAGATTPALNSYRTNTGAFYSAWQGMAMDELGRLYGQTGPGLSRIREGGAVYNYSNGGAENLFSGTVADWGDTSHPSKTILDGGAKFQTLSWIAWMAAAGLIDNITTPKVDVWEFAPERVLISSTAGPLTTHRVHNDGIRGGAINKAGLAYRSEVLGVEVNSRPYPASLTDDGKIQILPPEGQLWTAADQFRYLSAGRSGMYMNFSDNEERMWKDTAGVVLPVPVPMHAENATPNFANIITAKAPSGYLQFARGYPGNNIPLPGDAAAFRIGAGTRLIEGEFLNFGSGSSSSGLTQNAYTAEMRIRRRTAVGTNGADFLGMTNLVRLQLNPSTGVLSAITSSDPTFAASSGVTNGAVITTLPLDQWVTIRLVVDQRVQSSAYFWCGVDADGDGVFEIERRGSGACDGDSFAGARFVALANDTVADVSYCTFWEGAAQTALTPGVAPGLLPRSDAHKIIVGPAAAALRQFNFVDGAGITDVVA